MFSFVTYKEATPITSHEFASVCLRHSQCIHVTQMMLHPQSRTRPHVTGQRFAPLFQPTIRCLHPIPKVQNQQQRSLYQTPQSVCADARPSSTIVVHVTHLRLLEPCHATMHFPGATAGRTSPCSWWAQSLDQSHTPNAHTLALHHRQQPTNTDSCISAYSAWDMHHWDTVSQLRPVQHSITATSYSGWHADTICSALMLRNSSPFAVKHYHHSHTFLKSISGHSRRCTHCSHTAPPCTETTRVT